MSLCPLIEGFSVGNMKIGSHFPDLPKRRNRVEKFGVLLPEYPLEAPRLRLVPVIGNRRIHQAFELIQLAGFKTGMGLPLDLSYQAFRGKLVGEEPFALFLLEEKLGGGLVGLVGAWALSPNRGWPQILYAVCPESRGHGYAQEGSEALIHSLFRSESVMGVGAMVVGSNPASLAVLGKLGMELIHQWEGRCFAGLSRQKYQQSGCSPVNAPHRRSEGRAHPVLKQGLWSLLKKLLDHCRAAGTGTQLARFADRVCSILLALMDERGGDPSSTVAWERRASPAWSDSISKQ